MTMPTFELCLEHFAVHRGYAPRQPLRLIGTSLLLRPKNLGSRARVLPQLCPSPDPVSNESECNSRSYPLSGTVRGNPCVARPQNVRRSCVVVAKAFTASRFDG
jgi:hypothetical protein